MSFRLDLCRLTIIGPRSRTDLAVPLSLSLASVLPVVLRVAVPEDDRARPWILQRLGETPLDPEETVESLNLRDGDELHLRTAENPMPEMEFDDLSDGLATATNRRKDLWRPEYTRTLFMGLAGIALLVMLVGLLELPPGPLRTTCLATIAVATLVAATVIGRKTTQRELSTTIGLACCAYATVAGQVSLDNVPLLLDPSVSRDLIGGSISGLSLTVASVVLLGVAGLAIPIFGSAAVLGIGMTARALLTLAGLSEYHSALIVSAAAFLALVVGARVAIRLARLAAPELPRKAEELQDDILPQSASTVLNRADVAAGYLTTIAVSTSIMLVVTMYQILMVPNWPSATYVIVLASAILLRSQGFRVASQRIPVALAGMTGLSMVMTGLFIYGGPFERFLLVVSMLVVIVGLLLAGVRLPVRRPLPVWRRVADILEVLTALAVLPLLVYLLDLLAFMRGIGG